MIVILIVISTIVSCALYGKMQLLRLTTSLMKTCTTVVSIITGNLNDSEKQKKIFEQAFIQLKLVGLISWNILIIISPFLVAYICYNFIHSIPLSLFFNIGNTIISLLSILVWLLAKKYEKR